MNQFDLGSNSQRRRDKKAATKDKKATMKRLHNKVQPSAVAEEDNNGNSMQVKRAKLHPQT